MKNEKEKFPHYKELEESITYMTDSPESPYEMVNKYGTYEIQPTADTKHDFPTVAQGLAENAQKPTKAKKHKTSK